MPGEADQAEAAAAAGTAPERQLDQWLLPQAARHHGGKIERHDAVAAVAGLGWKPKAGPTFSHFYMPLQPPVPTVY